MASGEQLKALLKSHVDGDDDRFFSVAMQVAAHEARRGHGRLAEELRALIDSRQEQAGRRGAGPNWGGHAASWRTCWRRRIRASDWHRWCSARSSGTRFDA